MRALSISAALLIAACAPLSEQQIADLARWSSTAANHCAAAGKCPDAARCVDATVAALDLTATYASAADACRSYQ